MIRNSSVILRLVPKGLSRNSLTNNISTTNIILNSAAGPTDPIQQLYADKVGINGMFGKFELGLNNLTI